MKIFVTVKRVVDYNVRIQVRPDGSGVATAGVKMSMNPFDEIAVEEAVRLKEKAKVREIVVVTIGDAAAQEQLRSAMAMGCDRAIWVQADSEIQPLTAACILKTLIEKERPDMVIMGKQAIDDDCAQTPQMLAGLLEWPQATFASKIDVSGNQVAVTREIDAGLQTLSLDLPAIISSDLRLNQPRYIKLPDIMAAKRKPIENITMDQLAFEIPADLKTLETMTPPARKAGIKVESVAQLMSVLREKGLMQ